MDPVQILLDEALNAYVADTGFAKMERAETSSKSVSNAVYLTKGYLDPIIGDEEGSHALQSLPCSIPIARCAPLLQCHRRQELHTNVSHITRMSCLPL